MEAPLSTCAFMRENTVVNIIGFALIVLGRFKDVSWSFVMLLSEWPSGIVPAKHHLYWSNLNT